MTAEEGDKENPGLYLSTGMVMEAPCACETETPRNGIEARPVFRGDFDRYQSRGCHQVRINLWGWPAKFVERIMRRRWVARHMEPDT